MNIIAICQVREGFTRTVGFWCNHPDVILDTDSCWNGGESLLPIIVCGEYINRV